MQRSEAFPWDGWHSRGPEASCGLSEFRQLPLVTHGGELCSHAASGHRRVSTAVPAPQNLATAVRPTL